MEVVLPGDRFRKHLTFGYVWMKIGKCLVIWCCFVLLFEEMGVSENRGTPKWMVHDGKPY